MVASSVFIASPASAAPWDGNRIVFGPGSWQPRAYGSTAPSFDMLDVRVVTPPSGELAGQVWDGAGSTTITAAGLSITDEVIVCEEPEGLDVVTDATTGDLVLTCTTGNIAFGAAGLVVVSEIRVLAGGEVVRFRTTITNTGVAEATVDEVLVYTDFESVGELYDFDGQTDAALVVPAPESSNFLPVLNTAAARWVVHWRSVDIGGGLASGNPAASMVIGGSTATAFAEWSLAFGDRYEARIPTFTIPVGESREVVTFGTWSPQTLLDGGFSNGSVPAALFVDAADDVVAGMAEFSQLSGRLLNGITEPRNIVNWDVAEAPVAEPELADTGALETGWWAGAAAMMVLLGVAIAVQVNGARGRARALRLPRE